MPNNWEISFAAEILRHSYRIVQIQDYMPIAN